MTWEYFYERYDNWSKATLKQRIFTLENTGPMDEVYEVADAAGDEATGDRLVLKCLGYGMKVDFDGILDFDGLVSEKVMDELVRTAISQQADLKPELISDFDGLVNQDVISSMALHAISQKKAFSPDDILNLDGVVPQMFLDQAALATDRKYSEDELLSLEGVISEKALEKLEDRMWPGNKMPCESTSKMPGSKAKHHPLLGAFGLMGMLGGGQHNAAPQFRIGDHVRVRYRGQEGTIVDINGGLFMVSLDDGASVDSYSASQLEKAW